MGISSAGGRASLATLLAEPDFSLATFLLSVLGEGSFLVAARVPRAPRPRPGHRAGRPTWRGSTRPATSRSASPTSSTRAGVDPALRGRLRAAVERRHDALVDTAGLNADVFDALVVLAAGDWTPEAIARGYDAVQDLHHAMDDGRRQRLARLGFPPDEAAELSALHTRNFM